MLVANVPIYETGDAGRRSYEGFRAGVVAAGFRECSFARPCDVCEVDGDFKVMMGAHVEDGIWVANSGYEYAMATLLKKFEVKQIHEGSFKFCGREKRAA